MPDKLYVQKVDKRRKRTRKLVQFTHSSTISAGIMLLAAIVALIIANSGLIEPYEALWDTQLGVTVGERFFGLTLGTFINDALMAIFFLVVGLEIKYEVTVGELVDIRQALLPIVAAVGGVAVPIAIYAAFNHGLPTASGWGIPMATDIAFALGILALLGSRVPSSLKVFLSTLAIADDIIAILVIAVFYGHTPNLPWLLGAAVVFACLLLLNRSHVYRIRYYLILGVVLWICVYESGVHATLAGVLLAFTIPSRSPVNPLVFNTWIKEHLDHEEEGYDRTRPVLAQGPYIDRVDEISRVANYLTPPLSTLKKKVEPWSTFLVLPLFALSNAGVCLVGQDLSAILTSSTALGVFFGLVVGKPVGILMASILTVKSGLSTLPSGVCWRHMAGAAILGGVGFTMSIFVANLAFIDPSITIAAKSAILLASLVAGLCGYALLFVEACKTASYETDKEDPSNR